jgi:cell division protein FtsN
VKKQQRGNTLLGIIIGVVLGLGAALAVAVYVTKVPVPFMNKHQARTPEQDAAESRKNQNWDPNAPLYGKNPARPQPPAAGGSVTPAPGAAPAAPAQAPAQAAPAAPATGRAATSADPLGELAAARTASPAADPFLYFVQAGAFRTSEDAEAQRAKLSLMGLEARVTEREQSGRQVFRVRVGPFERREEADRSKSRLESGGFEAALVRVQR